jgi:CRP/FNR family transcriptional regulator
MERGRLMAPDTSDVLRRVPLLAGLSGRELKGLAKRFREHRYPEGAEVVVEGRTAAGFFVIAEGSATVSIDGRHVSTLSAGDWFGEVALIDDGPRSATIIAATDLRCFGITPWEFRPFVKEHPQVAWTLLQTLARRLREAERRETA